MIRATIKTRRALITGITGQDGSYLAEFLLAQGYEVHGVIRRVAIEDPALRLWRLRHLLDRLHCHTGCMESYPSLFKIIQAVQPDECYHLAAPSFVDYSFDEQISTLNASLNGTQYVLSALKAAAPSCRFYFAASSEIFGNPEASPQDERSHFSPRSPYGMSKVTGFLLTKCYRESHGLHASSGILYNHESPRRGTEFVTRKISRAVADIKHGRRRTLQLGNLDARRDWGFAGDYVRAMWRMLQADTASDYVIATGRTHSVREFLELAFDCVGLDWRDHVQSNEQLFRPAETHELRGNAARARDVLDWAPRVGFAELVEMMVRADLDAPELGPVPVMAGVADDLPSRIVARG